MCQTMSKVLKMLLQKKKTKLPSLIFQALDSIIEKLISVTNFWISRSCLGSLSVLSS